MKYSTLIFDAFDTVIHINPSKLPAHRVEGRNVPTTAPAVHLAYTDLFGKLSFDVFYEAFSQSFNEVTRRRRADLREILSQERFKMMLEMLGHTTPEIKDGAIETLTRAHMGLLRQSFEVRPEVVEVLDWAKGHYQTGMISNFAYAPTLHESLDFFGIRPAFGTVVISAEVGWCKPHPIIFDHAFQKMGVRPAEALFVGDQLYVDVYGALNSGMDAVWIETERQEWLVPDGKPLQIQPTYAVKSISEVIGLLENMS